jgi:4a-hydroxytetrahydrobiopterin dehydratase
MEQLSVMRCVPCTGKEPALEQPEIDRLKPQIPGWQVVEEEDTPKLRRSYKLKNFAEALSFTQRIGALAEQEDHHPAILTEWGKVTVTWWTHKIHGLHQNDFIMAAKTDEIFQSVEPGLNR